MKTEWRTMFFGWIGFSILFLLFEVWFFYEIFFMGEPMPIRLILGFVSIILMIPLSACVFSFLPDAWKEWRKASD